MTHIAPCPASAGQGTQEGQRPQSGRERESPCATST
nr:MAG TPA_asm: hypothetical protein [Caudoviricetes sp.]